MFQKAEYESYVALCRELRLEREWQEGDWYWWGTTYRGPICVTETVTLAAGESYFYESGPRLCRRYDGNDGRECEFDSETAAPDARTVDEVVWLPTLTDWLAMLEEVGYDDVRVFRDTWPAGAPPTYTARRGRIAADDSTGEPAKGPTREEACARLFMAVTGKC